MALLTRDDAITGLCIVAALAGFYAVGEYSAVGDAVRFGVLVGVGVVLPMALTNYSS